MNCRRIERLLSNSLEDRLAPGAARAVAVHLRECRSCRRLRDAMVAAETELREPADPLPPPGIEAWALRQWIAEREAPRWSGAHSLHTAIRAAALLLAVLSLTFILASPSFG
jgi:predicted anti-sigma-YlaC factor YlaD